MELILLNLVLAVINSFIAVYIALTRQHRRGKIIMLLLIGVSIWSYAYAMEMYFTTITSKIFWAYVQILGMSLLGAWPMLIAHVTGNDSMSGRKGAIIFSVVPIVTVLLSATNDLHGLVFQSLAINYLDPQMPLLKTFGLWRSFIILYGYITIFGGTLYAGKFFVKENPRVKAKIGRVILIVLVPVLFSVYYQLSTKVLYYNYTPTVASITSICLLIFSPSEFRIGDIMHIEYANVLGQMRDMVILVDEDNAIIHANPSARRGISRELGIPEDDIVGRSLASLFEMVELVGSFDDPSELIVNGRCFDISYFPIRNWRGAQTTTCCVLREVTARRNLEDKLRILHYYASNIAKAQCYEDVGEITENALKSSLGFSNGVLILTSEDKYSLIQKWGNAEENLSDEDIQRLAKVDEVKQCCVKDFFTEIDCSGHEDCKDLAMLCVPIIENINQVGTISIFREPDFVFNENQSRLLEIFSNHIASAVHSIKDEQTKRELQREEIQRILEGAGRVSNIVRHDLRSPLQTIKNAAYILQKDPSNDKMLRIINESIDYMVKIIEDLVYTENVSNLDLRVLNLNTLVQQSLNQVLRPNNIQFVQNLYPAPFERPFDKVKIQRMLDNLIKNAIEAMPYGGTLTVTTSRTKDELILSVEDTGQGMVDTSKLFTPFHTTKLNGMGLGLISVKQTVEAHNGVISVLSEPGKGTCFTIRFPVDEDYTGNSTTILSTITPT